jgi:hypothetical protein
VSDFGLDVSTYPDLDLSFTPISGQRVLAEAVMRRLETDRGTLVYDLDYGIGIRSWLSRSVTSSQLEELRSQIELECMADERVAAADVKMTWQREANALTISIALTPADGVTPPFRLVLQVTAVTLDLLSLG